LSGDLDDAELVVRHRAIAYADFETALRVPKPGKVADTGIVSRARE
jgi:hypothetical protein